MRVHEDLRSFKRKLLTELGRDNGNKSRDYNGEGRREETAYSLLSNLGIKPPVDVPAILISAALYGRRDVPHFYFPCWGKLARAF